MKTMVPLTSVFLKPDGVGLWKINLSYTLWSICKADFSAMLLLFIVTSKKAGMVAVVPELKQKANTCSISRLIMVWDFA